MLPFNRLFTFFSDFELLLLKLVGVHGDSELFLMEDGLDVAVNYEAGYLGKSELIGGCNRGFTALFASSLLYCFLSITQ